MSRSLASSSLKFLLTLITVLTFGSCASVDRNLMSVSNAISDIDPVTGRRELSMQSEQQEIAKANQTTASLLAQARKKGLKINQQLPQYAQIQRVLQRLKRVVHRPNLPWQVHLIESKTWNAFTIGGGKIFLFSGLFTGSGGIRGDDEIAVVLAHEMAHNTARHISERQAKSLITQLADKSTRNAVYQASFSTHQEEEADKFSTLYMALAGYDPQAAVTVWTRIAKQRSSGASSILHSHPLSHNRARNMQVLASKTRPYYQRGRLNPQTHIIKNCNTLFCNNRKNQNAKGGDGSGAGALLETVLNTYVETAVAKNEAARRVATQNSQVAQARQALQISNVRLSRNSRGQPVASGIATNLQNRAIRSGALVVSYLNKGKVVHQHQTAVPTLRAKARQPFSVTLKSGTFDAVRLTPMWVKF